MDPVITTVMDRETLDAFVDGGLAPEAAARLVLHLADCPGDRAYVDAVMETNVLLAAAYAEPLHAPLPERFRAAIFSAPPPPGSRRDRPARRRTGFGGAFGAVSAAARQAPRAAWAAAAAFGGLALAVALGVALAPGQDAPDLQVAGVGAEPLLRGALEANPSGPVAGATEGVEITLIASFFDAGGRPCREYEILDTAARALTEGVACREAAGGWTDEVAVASRVEASESRGGAFVPASGAGDEALGATLDRLGAGMMLTTSEEATLIAADWTR